jgi:hypothetical protein
MYEERAIIGDNETLYVIRNEDSAVLATFSDVYAYDKTRDDKGDFVYNVYLPNDVRVYDANICTVHWEEKVPSVKN